MIFYLIISIPLRFSKKYKNLWLISERPNEARDNGYWLYKYILENKPEINVRYVLSKDSPDYKKMPRKDLIIKPGSAEHYINYILSSFSISTHMHGACPGKSFVIPFLPFVRRKKTVFLQHGVTKDAINLRGGLDLITAVSEEEKRILSKSNLKYKDKISVCGFCRYDQLCDLSREEKEKIILVMPTFRKWLRDIARTENADTVFKKTTYFQRWNSFLNNNELLEILKQNNIKLIFFPHMEIQKLVHNFSTNSNIQIGRPEKYDIQDLLKRSSVLVTDYSSVFFDFVYMDKPVLFYQFDQTDFFEKHYKSSGKKYPFGDIFDDENLLVKDIIKTIRRNYTLKGSYHDEAKSFYKFRDNKNCARICKIIGELK